MQLLSLLTAGFLAATALAAPSPPVVSSKAIENRSTTICGQWDSLTTGTYKLYQNLWGKSSATSGSQCSTFTSLSGNFITWSTSWTWAGGPSSVKSYANVVVTQSTGYKISAISTIPTTWSYRYTGTSIVADVSYDIFTSSTATGSADFEIMIWLAALGGAGPISSGSPVSTPTINGASWKLYSGPNGATTVYSFVATSEITSFSGDLKLFFDYLVSTKGFSTSQYITSIGAGTEPFRGTDAVLTVQEYNVVINLESGAKTTKETAAATTPTNKATTPTTSKVTSTSGTLLHNKCGGTTTVKFAATTTAFTTPTTPTIPTTSKVASTTGVLLYGQCGGTGWTGLTTCASGTCKYSNPWYSQCLA